MLLGVLSPADPAARDGLVHLRHVHHHNQRHCCLHVWLLRWLQVNYCRRFKETRAPQKSKILTNLLKRRVRQVGLGQVNQARGPSAAARQARGPSAAARQARGPSAAARQARGPSAAARQARGPKNGEKCNYGLVGYPLGPQKFFRGLKMVVEGPQGPPGGPLIFSEFS